MSAGSSLPGERATQLLGLVLPTPNLPWTHSDRYTPARTGLEAALSSLALQALGHRVAVTATAAGCPRAPAVCAESRLWPLLKADRVNCHIYIIL